MTLLRLRLLVLNSFAVVSLTTCAIPYAQAKVAGYEALKPGVAREKKSVDLAPNPSAMMNGEEPRVPETPSDVVRRLPKAVDAEAFNSGRKTASLLGASDKDVVDNKSTQLPVAREIAQAKTNCPTSQSGFFEWFKRSVHSLPTPDAAGDLLLAVRQCQARLPEPVRTSTVACTSNLEKLGRAFDSYASPDHGLGVTLKPEPRDPPENGPLHLPEALYKPALIKAMTEQSNEIQLKRELDRLGKALPQARILRFLSGASNRRTVIVALPAPPPAAKREVTYVHVLERFPGESPLDYDVIRVNHSDNDQAPAKFDYFFVEPSKHLASVREERCLSCHRSGTIAAIPKDQTPMYAHTFGTDAGKTLKWFNDTRPVDEAQSNTDYSHLGPPIGPEDAPTRNLAFIMSCARKEMPQLDKPTAEKLMSKMSCVKCHSEDGRENTLKYPTHVFDFRLRIFNNVVSHGHMPLGADDAPGSKSYLKPQERQALLRCLKAEYFGGFHDSKYDPIGAHDGRYNYHFSQGNTKPGIFMEYLTSKCEAPKPSTSNSSETPISPQGPNEWD